VPPGPEVLAGTGAIEQLAGIVAAIDPGRTLVVAGTTALRHADIARRLRGRDTRYFTEFRPNPQLRDVLRGCALVESYRPDLILGVGGGSAMDVAKMIRLLPVDAEAALAALSEPTGLRDRPPPLVLVPTTAGTGSEVTRFAAVYVDLVKHSLDHPSVLADVALVDPALTGSCPAELTYSGTFDAFAHAVESTWSVRSTPQSRALAGDALRALVPVLREAPWPVPAATREVLSEAALRAGLAIDITRTTAAHAFAYPLTARYGVPHGLACALNLRWLLPYAAAKLETACRDPRGPAFAGRRMAEIAAALGAPSPARCGEVVAGFLGNAGFADRLGAYGVRDGDLPGLVESATGSARAGNNPVGLAAADVLPYLRAVV
jgi:alcohol dehydrogenase